MNSMYQKFFVLIFISVNLLAQEKFDKFSVDETFGNTIGTIVILTCNSEEQFVNNTNLAESTFTPCSTFKIWNSLIALENNLIKSPEEDFYKWDGKEREIKLWNRDMTLKEAFNVSCVPAFQDLARKIGNEKMKQWIDSIKYGDRDISSGIDDFWLTRKDKKSIKISSIEQAQMIKNLLIGKLPFSTSSISVLKELMFARKLKTGNLYGKTGSGDIYNNEKYKNIGWYVGFVETKSDTYAFACLVLGENVMGNDAKEIVIKIFQGN
ncbi:MAG: hypothetical protein Fur0015_02010 [Ignavibacteriales bacterium]